MSFYIYKNNEQIGPLDDSVVEEGLRAGRFSPLDLASRDGATGWESLSTFFPFISQSRSAPPRPPAPPPPSPPPPSPSSSTPSHMWMRDSAANQPEEAKPFEPQQPGGNVYVPPYQPPPLLQQTPQYQTGDSYVAAPSQADGPLPMAGMVLGIVTMCLMIVGLIPCLGWLNWVTLSVGTVGVILCLISILIDLLDEIKKYQKTSNTSIFGLPIHLRLALFVDTIARNKKAVISLSLTLIALFFGTIRLLFGGGCI